MSKDTVEFLIDSLKFIRDGWFYLAAPFAIALFTPDYRYYYIAIVLLGWAAIEAFIWLLKQFIKTS